MTKEVLKIALEALEPLEFVGKRMDGGNPKIDEAITAIKEALTNEALDKMAENARELGLDYEPAQTEHHQDWCASLTQMLMSMPPKPAPCNCKPKPEQPKVRTGNCLRVGVCASEGHKIAPQRKPLTDEDLRKLADKHLFYQPEGYEVSGVFALARAIEAAHGIGGEA